MFLVLFLELISGYLEKKSVILLEETAVIAVHIYEWKISFLKMQYLF